MHYFLVTDTITENLYTLKDIYTKNIQTLIDLNSSAASIDFTWFELDQIQTDLQIQSDKLDAVNLRITEVENLAFSYGL